MGGHLLTDTGCARTQSAARFRLPADRAAATLMRAELVDHLAGRVSEQSEHAVKLLVTELVTNSVRHSGSEEVHVSVSVAAGLVRVRVSDDGPGFEPSFRCDVANGGGFGLFLVDQMSRRWGVEHDGKHSSVWFELGTTD